MNSSRIQKFFTYEMAEFPNFIHPKSDEISLAHPRDDKGD